MPLLARSNLGRACGLLQAARAMWAVVLVGCALLAASGCASQSDTMEKGAALKRALLRKLTGSDLGDRARLITQLQNAEVWTDDPGLRIGQWFVGDETPVGDVVELELVRYGGV